MIAIATDPWTQHMRHGEFEAAWRVSDDLRAAGLLRRDHTAPRHQQLIWDGSRLEGRRVLVRCYHGLGDTIQFGRYLPLLAELASEVTLWVQPALLALLGTVRGVDVLTALHDGTPDVPYDVDIEIMELPYIFRTTLETVPADVPYVHVTPLPCVPARAFTIGVVWQAGDWDLRRGMPLDCLGPLAKMPGVSVVSLQRGAAQHAWPISLGRDCSSDDVLQTARTMQTLDLVLSVDTMPAHLAGALGVPVWTLLHADCDWRWQVSGDRTPWYPTMRLFRQHAPGNWRSVMDDVRTALTRELAQRRGHAGDPAA